MVPSADARDQPVRIDDELKAFIESGVSVVLGTRDETLAPEIVRAWGPRVSRDRRSIRVCVPESTSGRTRANLAGNGQIAVAFSLPSNYQTVQLKGRYAGAAEPSDNDLAMVDRHREAFARVNEGLGVARPHVEDFWRRELAGSSRLIAIRFTVQQIFNQTPGPGAGLPR